MFPQGLWFRIIRRGSNVNLPMVRLTVGIFLITTNFEVWTQSFFFFFLFLFFCTTSIIFFWCPVREQWRGENIIAKFRGTHEIVVCEVPTAVVSSETTNCHWADRCLLGRCFNPTEYLQWRAPVNLLLYFIVPRPDLLFRSLVNPGAWLAFQVTRKSDKG